jgi:hypothetical protein
MENGIGGGKLGIKITSVEFVPTFSFCEGNRICKIKCCRGSNTGPELVNLDLTHGRKNFRIGILGVDGVFQVWIPKKFKQLHAPNTCKI